MFKNIKINMDFYLIFQKGRQEMKNRENKQKQMGLKLEINRNI